MSQSLLKLSIMKHLMVEGPIKSATRRVALCKSSSPYAARGGDDMGASLDVRVLKSQ